MRQAAVALVVCVLLALAVAQTEKSTGTYGGRVRSWVIDSDKVQRPSKEELAVSMAFDPTKGKSIPEIRRATMEP